MAISPGLYRHYKGNDYQIFQTVCHSETREQLVLYRCLYDDFSWWVRPLTLFTETVEIAGEIVPRFQFVRALTPADIASYPALPWDFQ